jgi:hypothetical protein
MLFRAPKGFAAERETARAGVAMGSREGLELEPEELEDQQAVEDLWSQQDIVFRALKWYLNQCCKVIKHREWDTKDIVTPDRFMHAIEPLKDYSQLGQTRKILGEFFFEILMRKKRNTPLAQEFLTDSRSASRKKVNKTAVDSQFEQQNTELMNILKELDRELSTFNETKLPQADGQDKVEHPMAEEGTGDNFSPEPSIFHMSI